jgi:hypothetical protein
MFSRAITMAALGTVALLTLPLSADAQWPNHKTPGIPRTPDGKPNLSAPAPRTADGKPDLSGLWRTDTAGSAETGKAMDRLKPHPWAEALYEKRKENFGSDAPSVLCLPPGPMVDMGVGKVVQTPNLLLMLFNGTLYREIFLDGRDLPKDPNPDWMGYSVGHWDGDTLVIESVSFNDRTWLDDDGHPHTEALRVTERLRRADLGHMEIVRTLADPGAFVEPWTVPVKLELYADNEQLEYVCNENERDRPHLIGKASDEKSVKVAPEVLSKYAGSYEVRIPPRDQILNLIFRLEGEQLVVSGDGPSTPLKALSETEFSWSGGSLEFVRDSSNVFSQVILRAVEGDLTAIRK